MQVGSEYRAAGGTNSSGGPDGRPYSTARQMLAGAVENVSPGRHSPDPVPGRRVDRHRLNGGWPQRRPVAANVDS